MVALGHFVKHLDYNKESVKEYFFSNNVDLVFAYSDEGLLSLPLSWINKKDIPVIIGALPYNHTFTTFDPHTPLMRQDEFYFITKLKRKLVWSQHQPIYNHTYYSAYHRCDIEVVFLPHCADTTNFVPLTQGQQFDLKYDFFFIGNLGHKKFGNVKLLKQIFSHVDKNRVLIYGDEEWTKIFNIKSKYSPPNINLAQLYSSSTISPNIHSLRQKRFRILINDRTFHIPIYGGFQICDNPLIEEYFDQNEIVVATDDNDYIEKFRHFKNNTNKRIPYIQKAGEKVYKEHSYFNRIAFLWERLGIKEKIMYDNVLYKPFHLKTLPMVLDKKKKMFFFIETRLYLGARKCKRTIKNLKLH